jgi:DNA-binding beta-propeller fold protein YncE
MNPWFASFRSVAVVWFALSGSAFGLLAQTPVTAPVATALRALRNGWKDPARIATDTAGHIFVTDAGSGQLVIRDEAGRLLLAKGGFNGPLGIAADAQGRLFLGEAGHGQVSILLSNGTRIGQLGQGPGEFLLPNHLAVDPDPSGLIYVADSAANLIKVYSPNGPKLREFGAPGTGPGQFDFPTGLFISAAGEVFVADQNNNRIQVFDRNGQFLRSFGKRGMMGNSPFGRIQGLAGDAQGRIYVADAFHGLVRVIDANGLMISTVGSFGTGAGELTLPSSVVVDRNNRLLVVSPGTTRIEVFGLDTFADPHILQAAFLLDQTTLMPETAALGTRRRGEDHDEHEDRDDDDEREHEPGQGRGTARRAAPVNATLTVTGVDPHQIIASSIRANGVPSLPLKPGSISDPNGSGLFEMRLQFSNQALLATLPVGTSTLYVTGRVASGEEFEAATTVTVAPPAPAAPKAPRGTATRLSTRRQGSSR